MSFKAKIICKNKCCKYHKCKLMPITNSKKAVREIAK